MLVGRTDGLDANTLRNLADQARQSSATRWSLLGSEVGQDRAHLVAALQPAVVERGVKAGEVVRAAAPVMEGGGGGRDTLAQAGGRDPEKLPEALATARAEIEKALG